MAFRLDFLGVTAVFVVLSISGISKGLSSPLGALRTVEMDATSLNDQLRNASKVDIHTTTPSNAEHLDHSPSDTTSSTTPIVAGQLPTSESNSVAMNSTESPVKSSREPASSREIEVTSTASDKAPPPLTKKTTADPHDLSAASVEKFLEKLEESNYISRNGTEKKSNETSPSLNARDRLAANAANNEFADGGGKSTEAPSVAHLLHDFSLATEPSTTTNKKTSSSATKKITKKTVANKNAPTASALSAEKSRISLGTGNIIGITIGVSIFVIGVVFVGLSNFRTTRRRSSYTEMFIHDNDSEEEIALTDYADSRDDSHF